MLKRRFIAGAVCPRCAGMDKIVMYDNEQGQRVRECVSCGYHELFAEDRPPHEIKTRVNEPRAGEKPLPHETEVQVVKFVDPGASRKDH
jgi:uncharacterized metal-binding protein (TIGR02443 family)